jgi:hypothetical protein
MQTVDDLNAILTNSDIPTGLQCCLFCGRLLTDRVLHDAIEAPALAAFRAVHPELWSADEDCEPCVEEYRNLLEERKTRSERVKAATASWVPAWLGRLVGRQSNEGESTLSAQVNVGR